jgi:hypothetical protein
MAAMLFTVSTLVLVDIGIVIVMASMAVVVEITSLEVDGGETLLESSCAFAYSHLS